MHSARKHKVQNYLCVCVCVCVVCVVFVVCVWVCGCVVCVCVCVCGVCGVCVCVWCGVCVCGVRISITWHLPTSPFTTDMKWQIILSTAPQMC